MTKYQVSTKSLSFWAPKNSVSYNIYQVKLSIIVLNCLSEEEIKPEQLEQLEESSDESQEKTDEDKKALAKKKTQEDEIIEVRVDARLGELTAVITSTKGELAELQMKRTSRMLSKMLCKILCKILKKILCKY